jgi:secreted trypsin-like serine protease
MKSFVAFLPLLALVGACADAPPSAPRTAPSDAQYIINGTLTGNAYGAVGALLFDFDEDGLITSNDQWCTGTLVTPTAFLTAAHCVVGSFTPAGTQFYVSFAPDLHASNATFIKADSYVSDPLRTDLALVFIPAQSTRGITPYNLPSAGELDKLAANGKLNNAIFINVGYGSSASITGMPALTYDGKRAWSESEFLWLQKLWLGLLMNPNATGLGGDCYGDSGGPKFLSTNPGVVYATVSFGDRNCRATSVDFRTDTKAARDFLGQFIPLP